MMKDLESIQTQKSFVRLIGFLYLLVIICAGFSQGYVRATLVETGDPIASAHNILAHEGLFRIGLVSDLIAFILDAIISILLYQLFKPYHKKLAMISSALRLIAHPAIASINLLNHYMALEVLRDNSFLTVFDADQLQSISLLLMKAHQYGYLIAGAFFGVHCLLLGILLYKSFFIPKFFGVMMIIAALGYLMESFGNFLYPGNEVWLAWLVGLSAALGEVELTLFMLIKGIRINPDAAYKKVHA